MSSGTSFTASAVTPDGGRRRVRIVSGYLSDFDVRVLRSDDDRSYVVEHGLLIECEAGGPKRVVRAVGQNPANDH